MADEEKKTKHEEKKTKAEQGQQSGEQKTSGGRLPWIIVGVTVLVCAALGFVFGRIFGGPSSSAAADPGANHGPGLAAGGNAKNLETASWYYDMEPVVANLDEPGVTRYVRATLTLEMSSEMEQKKGASFLDQRKPFITNWLAIYLASLTLEDIRGDQNLKRIQAQMLDILNEKLFTDARPKVKHILFKEFAVQ